MASFNIERYSKAFFTVSVALLLSSTLVMGIDRVALSPMLIPGESSSACSSDEARQAALECINNDVKVFRGVS